MVKQLFFSVLMVLAASIYASAETTKKVMLEEHFDNCTAGTEESPAGDYSMTADNLFSRSGWTVGGVGSAGGCIFINEYGNMSFPGKGFVGTPKLNLQGAGGKATFTFRARLNRLPEHEKDYDDNKNTNLWYLNVLYRPATYSTTTYSYELTDEWQDFTIEVENADYSTSFTFYGHNVLVDDVMVEQEDRGIDAPANPNFTDLTVNGFTANWDTVEGAVAYRINVFSLDEDGNRVYAPKLENAKIFGGTTTKKVITGLDMHTVYYFNVKSLAPNTPDGKEGQNSTESQTVEVLGFFEAPQPKLPSDGTQDGFTAAWNGVPNTQGYNLETFIFHTAPENEIYTLINEDFSRTRNSFVANGFLDDQLSRAQWFTYFTLNQEADVLTLSNAQKDLTPGTLASPVYNFPDGAKVTVSFDYKGNNVSRAQLVIGNGSYIPVMNLRIKDGEYIYPTDTWQTLTKEFIMEEGTSTQIILQLMEGEGSMSIDNLKVTVSLTKGDKVTVPYVNTSVTDAESHYVSTEDAVRGDMLGFRVTGYALNQHNYYIYTPTSDIMGVPVAYDREPTAINGIREGNKGEAIDITGNTISVNGNFSVYGMDGARIYSGSGSVTLPGGLYIVSTSTRTVKVLVK